MCPLKGESTDTSLHDHCDIGEQLEQYALVDDVDGSDDDFDEADDPCPLFLGFVVDDPESQASLPEMFPNKAGGTPTWLDPVHLPSGSASVCDFCKEPLQFVLQINAPLDEKESAYHRTIFVLMCPSMACLRKDQLAQQRNSNEGLTRSVKVFRCQMPAVNPFYTIDNEIAQGIADQQRFRAAVCSWCNTWKGDQLCSGCRSVRYCSKKHQLAILYGLNMKSYSESPMLNFLWLMIGYPWLREQMKQLCRCWTALRGMKISSVGPPFKHTYPRTLPKF